MKYYADCVFSWPCTHQIFDCAILGPYSAVDLWVGRDVAGKRPSHSNGDSPLVAATYARDSSRIGRTRDMDLPCTSAKLNQDHLPPFTCGSDTRRALIKYFARKYLSKDGLGNLVTTMVQERIRLLTEQWGSQTQFQCLCNNDTEGTFGNHFKCCERPDLTTPAEREEIYDPASWLKERYDTVTTIEVMQSVTEKIKEYLPFAFTHSKAFKEFAREETSWNDALQTVASDQGVFDTTVPLVHYSNADVMHPFKSDKSVWDLCTGMVGQVVFTQPLQSWSEGAEYDDAWTLSRIAARVVPEYDPTMPADFDGSPLQSEHVSMLEKYVSEMLKDALAKSPLYWHYAMRYVPSDSLVCLGNYSSNFAAPGRKISVVSEKLSQTSKISNKLRDVDMLGYAAFPLGMEGNVLSVKKL